MVDSDKERMMKSQIRKQNKLIKKLKNIIKMYAPYMEFTEEYSKKHHNSI